MFIFSSKERGHPAEAARVVPKLRPGSAQTHEVRRNAPTENSEAHTAGGGSYFI